MDVDARCSEDHIDPMISEQALNDVGAAPATTYNPMHLDVRQWIQVLHDLGARYAVLTAKHMPGLGPCPRSRLLSSQGRQILTPCTNLNNAFDSVGSFCVLKEIQRVT